MVTPINNLLIDMLTVLGGRDYSGAGALPVKFHAGEVMEALVLSKQGDAYLLKTGGNEFLARSEQPLQTGKLVRLLVLGSKDDTILLKNMSAQPGEEAERASGDRTLQLIRKYGITQEKEIILVRELLNRIPCEENTAVRCLLDPYLLAALFIPGQGRDQEYQKLEISGYNSAIENKRVWEVCIDLDMPELGRLDLNVRMVESCIFLRIWAESKQTEDLLRAGRAELAAVCPQIEIVPAAHGPLFRNEPHRDIDLRV